MAVHAGRWPVVAGGGEGGAQRPLYFLSVVQICFVFTRRV
jgi:hypothetical protein